MSSPRGIQRIARSEGVEKFIEALEMDGGVIITDFTDPATVAQANAEVKPWIEQQKNSQGAKVGGAYLHTSLVTNPPITPP